MIDERLKWSATCHTRKGSDQAAGEAGIVINILAEGPSGELVEAVRGFLDDLTAMGLEIYLPKSKRTWPRKIAPIEISGAEERKEATA